MASTPIARAVITVTGGIAEVHEADAGVDVIILDFDHVDEYGSKAEKEKAEELLQEQRYDELQEFLHDTDFLHEEAEHE